MENRELQRVVVVDIKMPFMSMVVFMVKWAVAALPALLILAAIWFVLMGLLAGLMGGIGGGMSGGMGGMGGGMGGMGR